MFKSTTIYTVDLNTYIPDIFPDGLPFNAFIDKGRCAIRATSGEMANKTRCTLLIVPNIGILHNKLNSKRVEDRPDYIVYGEISFTQVVEMMKNTKAGLKIMSTPEGMKKVMDAAEKVGRLNELYQSWFLLLDESHTFISEAYRENILVPFKYFWNFHNKSILSATPYYFSDSRFYDLDYYQIKFTEPLGKVTLINAVSVVGTLNYLLKNANDLPGNIHIFYNSVTEIRKAIHNAGLTVCSIYCANDADNIKKLEEYEQFFVPEPNNSNYSKINFYTSKYFEGWDLEDENATIVLVTDIYKEHTQIGIASKGKQAIGRLRNSPNQIIHIANHRHESSMIPLEVFKEEYQRQANTLIDEYNASETKKLISKDGLKRFADIEKSSKQAKLHLNKLDQQINESACNEIYQNIKFLVDDWKKAYYEVELVQDRHKLESKTSIQRKSAATRLKEAYEELEEIDANPNLTFNFGNSREQQIRDANPVAYKAFKLLDKKVLEKHKYNPVKVEHEIILKENVTAEEKLARLLKRTFKIEKNKDFYFNSFITSKLQDLYNKVSLKDPKTGDIKKASASDLETEGWFFVDRTKRMNDSGKREHGMVIKGYKLKLKTVK